VLVPERRQRQCAAATEAHDDRCLFGVQEMRAEAFFLQFKEQRHEQLAGPPYRS
jgi:hypothetical protein